MKSKLVNSIFYIFLILFLGLFLLYPIAGVIRKAFFFGDEFSVSLFMKVIERHRFGPIKFIEAFGPFFLRNEKIDLIGA